VAVGVRHENAGRRPRALAWVKPVSLVWSHIVRTAELRSWALGLEVEHKQILIDGGSAVRPPAVAVKAIVAGRFDEVGTRHQVLVAPAHR